MSKTIDAMNQTLEELERYQTKRQDDRFADAIAKLRAAITSEEAQTVDPSFWLIRKVPSTKDQYFIAEGSPPSSVLEVYGIEEATKEIK